MVAVLGMFVFSDALPRNVLELVGREVGGVGQRGEVEGWDNAKAARLLRRLEGEA